MHTTNNSPLERFLKKPALYFGNRAGYLREIEALDAGYRLGVKHGLIPEAFVDFVIQRLPPDEQGAEYWAARIRGQAHGEREEWELFLRLFAEYCHDAA